MVHRVPMVARRLAVAALLAGVAAAFVGAQGATSPPTSPQKDSQSQTDGSSSRTHHKGPGSVHHTKVAEEVGPPPDLPKAEDLIQKKDYASAEPLLRQV